MKKVKYVDLSVEGIVERFYLMMIGAIILGFLNHFILATIWGFALTVSCILGIGFKVVNETIIEKEEGKNKMKELKTILPSELVQAT